MEGVLRGVAAAVGPRTFVDLLAASTAWAAALPERRRTEIREGKVRVAAVRKAQVAADRKFALGLHTQMKAAKRQGTRAACWTWKDQVPCFCTNDRSCSYNHTGAAAVLPDCRE